MGRNLSDGKTASLIFLCLLVLFLSLLSASHFLEGLNFAKAIEDEDTGSLYFFHPHHLIYAPTGYVCHKAARLVGYTGRAVRALQFFSAVMGALGVSIFFLLLRTIGVRRFIAAVSSLFLAFSYSYWYHSVNAESNVPALTLLIGSLFFLAHSGSSSSKPLLCGVLHGGAVLFHQAHMLFVVPASFFFLLSGRRRTVGWYFLGFLLSLSIPYLVVGSVVAKSRSVGQFLHWATLYLHSESSYLQVGSPRVGAAVKDIGISFFGGHYLLLKDYRTALCIGAVCVVSLFLLVSLLRVVMNWKRLRSHFLHAVVVMSITYGGFHLFWDHYSFWMVQLVSAFLVLALLWDGASRRSSILLTCILGMYFALNLFGNIIPKHLSPPQYVQFIHELREQSGDGDLFLVLGLAKLDSRLVDYIDANIPYSLGRNYLTLPDIVDNREYAIETIQRRISQGANVYTWWDFTPEVAGELDACYADAAAQLFSAYRAVPAFKKGELAVMRLVPIE